MPTNADPLLPAREGLKELLVSSSAVETSPAPAGITQPSTPDAPTPTHVYSRWEHCLDLLVEEFLSRKIELLRLNKARRDQIEEYLRDHSKLNISLDQAVHGRPNSPEFEALQLFAHQSAVFQLLQILLVKRWVDRGHISPESLKPSGHTLNWQITSFLKKNIKQGILGRHDWSFLKQNIFSWYSPQNGTRERLREMMEPVNLAKEESQFPAQLLRWLGGRSRLSLLGFSPTLIDSNALWQLLLEQKAADLRLDSYQDIDFSSASKGAILLSGLGNGESLQSLRALSQRDELHGVWAYTDSDFERFLSEMFILWDCETEIPRINLLSRQALKELSHSYRGATLFHDSVRVPHQAQFAACFQDRDGRELDDALALIEPLRENGLLLIASNHFWPTDASERCEKLREQILKHASVRLIVDLRQLTGSAGESLPKGITILEKCEGREIRDSNRPQMLRARGHLQKHQVEAFWAAVLEYVRAENNPGEVSTKSLTSVGEGVRLESMAAAASQQQLRSSPWVNLSDPRFYDASSRLRRSIHKAHTFGSLLRWKSGMALPSRRGVLLREQGKFLLASLPDPQTAPGEHEAHQYLYLPDNSVAEHPSFFLSQVYSAPVQFWFRLETEQSPQRRARSFDRQTEQRLKLMPLLRLFEPGTLVTAQSADPAPVSLEEARLDLTRIFRLSSRGMAENARIHEIVISLENAISQNIQLCSEYAGHLFPELSLCRWDLPPTLPEVAPKLALEIFSHLDSSPLAHHPAVQITRLRTAQDFKVTNVEYNEMPMGGLGELKLFHGMDLALKLTGPTLILCAANEEIQKRLGRPWREISERLRFPTDIGLVHTQLREVVRSVEQQLNITREYLAVMDQIFCCLFELSPSFSDESTRQAIRHHLSPNDSRFQLHFPREGSRDAAREAAAITLRDSVAPTKFLQ